MTVRTPKCRAYYYAKKLINTHSITKPKNFSKLSVNALNLNNITKQLIKNAKAKQVQNRAEANAAKAAANAQAARAQEKANAEAAQKNKMIREIIQMKSAMGQNTNRTGNTLSRGTYDGVLTEYSLVTQSFANHVRDTFHNNKTKWPKGAKLAIRNTNNLSDLMNKLQKLKNYDSGKMNETTAANFFGLKEVRRDLLNQIKSEYNSIKIKPVGAKRKND